MDITGFIIKYGKLGQIIGISRAKQYCLITIGIYVLLFGIISALFVDSIDSIVEILAENYGQGNESPPPISMGISITAASISMIVVRYIIYFREIKGNRKGILSTTGLSFLSIFSLMLWYFISLFPVVLFIIIILFVGYMILSAVGLSEVILTLYVGALFELMFIMTFGLSAVAVVWRTKWIFPESLRDTMSKFNRNYLSLIEIKEEVESAMADEDLQATASQLIGLKTMYQSYTPSGELPSHAQRKLDGLNTEINALAGSLCQNLLDRTELAIKEDQYIDGHNQLDAAEEIIAGFNVSKPRVMSLRDTIDNELDKRATDLEDKTREKLEQSDTARADNQYDLAETRLSEAKNTFDQLREIPSVDVPADLRQQITGIREAIRTDIENDQIQLEKESIASLLDIEPDDISITDTSIERYEMLDDVVCTIQEGKSTYGGYPWETIEATLVDDISHLTVEDLHEYEATVSGSIAILKYLSMVNESHPSVDGERWREAVRTALKNQSPDILTPILSQIERLKSGLWEQEQFYNLSWEEFEELVGALYEDRGYDVEVTQGVADLGVDVWAERNGERIAIQVKQYADGNTVGRETLQKLASTISKGDADRVIIITSGEFARTAEVYASDFGSKMELINGEKLVQMLSESEVPPAV